jgi:hypothetical protein
VWDSPVEAGEFYDLLGRAVERRFDTKAKTGASSGGRSFSASGRSIQLSTAEVQGRPVVIYADVPQGANTNIIQPGQVRLTQ